MATRSNLPYAAAGVVATAAALYYLYSNADPKLHRDVPPVYIQTTTPAKEVYLHFRDPVFYISLTPESQYTVLSSETQSTGMDYSLHHQVTSSRSVTTKCRRDWADENLTFWDSFPVLSCAFQVRITVVQEREGVVKVGAEVDIAGSNPFLRMFFGVVSPKQVRTRLERLKTHYETQRT